MKQGSDSPPVPGILKTLRRRHFPMQQSDLEIEMGFGQLLVKRRQGDRAYRCDVDENWNTDSARNERFDNDQQEKRLVARQIGRIS